MANPNRPLSPHLQVYRPQITSVLSITHRATGIVLAGGAVLFSYWIMAATGRTPFPQRRRCLGLVRSICSLGDDVFTLLSSRKRHPAFGLGRRLGV